MLQTNLVSPVPSPARSDVRSDAFHSSDASRDNGFGSIYDAAERRPSGDAPRKDAAGASDAAPFHDRGSDRAKAKGAGSETPSKGTATDDSSAGTDGEVTVPEIGPQTADLPAFGANEDTEAAADVAAVPEQALPVTAPTTAPQDTPADTPEHSTPRVAARDSGQVTASPAGAAAAPPPEVMVPDPPTAADPGTDASRPASPAPVPTQAAQTAVADHTRAEQVTVRRVRPESAAESDGPRARPESAPQVVKAPGSPSTAPVDQTTTADADAAGLDMLDSALADVAPSEGRSTADHVARTEATLRHDTPRPVMQQVAEAARALRDGPVELTLQPEELGKVRMTLTADPDGTMTFLVQAERSETLDLLRRHIGDLARELKDMGFENLSFSFGQDRPSANQPEITDAKDGSDRTVAAIPLAQQGFAPRPAPAGTSSGLDLRL